MFAPSLECTRTLKKNLYNGLFCMKQSDILKVKVDIGGDSNSKSTKNLIL